MPERPSKRFSFFSLLKDAFTAWNVDGAAVQGSSLAFYSMLSMGPLLLICVSIAGLAFGHDQASHYIIAQMRGLFGAQGASALESVITHSQDKGKDILSSLIGLATLLLSAAGFFAQLQSALNAMFEVPKQKTGALDFVMRRLLSFGMVLGICLLLLVSLVISAGLAAFTGLFTDSLSAVLLQITNLVLSLLISTVLFALVFKILPDVHVNWSDVWIGAGLTAVLFAIGKFLIGLYLGRSTFGSTYGAAGSLIVLLVWVYYSAQIIFFGAEFTRVNMRARGRAFVLKRGVILDGPVSPEPKALAEAVRKDSAKPPHRPEVTVLSLAVISSVLMTLGGILRPARGRR